MFENEKLQEQINRLKRLRLDFQHSPVHIKEKAELKIKNYIADCIYVSNAENMALLSHCVSQQVGCLIVKDGRTLSTGINGTSSGDVNCDSIFPYDEFNPQKHRAWADLNEIHAEMNAINFAAKKGIKLLGSTLYCSLQPCAECSKNIPAVGLKRIVFGRFYPRVTNFSEQVETLSKKGVIIEKLQSLEEFEKNLSFYYQLELKT